MTPLQRKWQGHLFRAVLQQLGFRSDGQSLLDDLPISGAPFYGSPDQATSVWSGSFDDRETIIFEFRTHGDFGYSQTIMAVKSSCEIPQLSTLWRASEIECLRLGAYILMYREQVEIPDRKLRSFIEDCSGLMQYIESKQLGM